MTKSSTASPSQDGCRVVAELASMGVTIVTPISAGPGGWSADLLDPDGFGLGLWQAGDKPRSFTKTA